MHIKKGDKVQVISGKDKGAVGEVLKVIPKENRVVVKGVNIQKHHKKPQAMGEEGGIIEQEGSIHASNVLLYSEKLQKGIRTSKKIIDGKKVRVSNKTEEKFD
ncbi:MAG: 50S ribosomal protein L24 [Peptoniphilaceae bacterium]|nr:50S ribosomal protein L24 [Peptoniphilaceae bacterium]MDD7382918.1 50S ribosomal protein L24 [Peptoniphilaceae bacterium]MDY3737669.1 50S ribosomal protein L24 [Peptoniphilaceae bacterium]